MEYRQLQRLAGSYLKREGHGEVIAGSTRQDLETIVAAHGHKTSALYGVQSADAQGRCAQLQTQLALAESSDSRVVGVMVGEQ